MIAKNLYKKILEARKLIKSVSKTQGEFEKFKTVKSENVMEEIKNAIDTIGIIFIPSIISKNQFELPHWKDQYGKIHMDSQVDLEMEYTILDPESGEYIVTKWFAIGQHDKEMAKAEGMALTYAEKYFFMKFFQISTNVDDPDCGDNVSKYNDLEKETLKNKNVSQNNKNKTIEQIKQMVWEIAGKPKDPNDAVFKDWMKKLTSSVYNGKVYEGVTRAELMLSPSYSEKKCYAIMMTIKKYHDRFMGGEDLEMLRIELNKSLEV